MKVETFNREDAKKVETKRSKSGSTYKIYTFECKGCGADINLQVNRMKYGSGLCTRCGQKKTPYAHIYKELVHSCRKRGVREVIMTFDEFLKLIENKECHYCGKELIYSPHTRDAEGNATSRAYQLDRKDNSIDYTFENCTPCCWDCNRLKSDIYTYEEFIRIAVVLKEIQEERKSNDK